jgi:nucleolar protein 56
MELESLTDDSVTILETVIGIFGVAESEGIIAQALYPTDVDEIVGARERLERGEVTPWYSNVLKEVKKRGFKRIIITNRTLGEEVEKSYGLRVSSEASGGAYRYLLSKLEELAYGYLNLEKVGVLALIHEVTERTARNSIQRIMGGKEALIRQTVQLLNELDTMLNNLSSRVREWYGLHFPELGRRVRDHRQYMRFITVIGDRNEVSREALGELGFQERDVKRIYDEAVGSMGAAMSGVDLDETRDLAGLTLMLFGYRERLTDYISSLAEEIAPNVSEVAGLLLAAKLVEKAGGLKRLALLPSSTIQVLGAEKAMYRAIKTSAKPPKHGLLFQHPFVHGASRGDRGRRARILAGKIAIAARADFFSGRSIGAELRRELEEGV